MRISRRDVARLAGAAVVSMALPGSAQNTPQAEREKSELAELEAKLAEPLSEEARRIAGAGLAGNKRNAAQRLAARLPENSEPCTLFVAQPAKRQ